ncbi:MAG: D-2-hydroxyacid dehydrogenase [Opitutus sp.]
MSTAEIFIYAHLDPAAYALLQTPLADHRVTIVDKHVPLTDAAMERFRSCTICFGNVPKNWLTPELPLRWLQLESIGFEYYENATHLPTGLVITNLKGLFDEPAAETAIGGLLAFYRGIHSLVRAQDQRRWVSLEVRPQTELLHGKRVVMLGHGSIGRRLRQLLEAFGCTVQSFARTSRQAELRSVEALDEALQNAEVVVSCLPNTAATRGLMDQRRLAFLGRKTVFVNLGRGTVVDEPALITALHDGRLGGAILDVAWEEPLLPDHPLWTCPRTLLLQHTGGGTADELSRKADVFLRNLTRLKTGRPLENTVDLARGY